MQVRFLMLNTMCLTSLHNIQQDFIYFIPVFFLIVDADDFLLAFEINCTEFQHALFPRERDLQWVFLPAHPASFAHKFVSGMQSFYFSESQDCNIMTDFA